MDANASSTDTATTDGCAWWMAVGVGGLVALTTHRPSCLARTVCLQTTANVNRLSAAYFGRQWRCHSADVYEKHERRRVASLPASSVFKNCNKLTISIVNYVSASGFLKIVVIIIIICEVLPSFSTPTPKSRLVAAYLWEESPSVLSRYPENLI